MSSSLPETWTEVAMQDFAEGIFAYCSCKAPATQITAYPAALPNLRSTLLSKVDLYPGDDSLHDFVIGTVAEAWIQSGV